MRWRPGCEACVVTARVATRRSSTVSDAIPKRAATARASVDFPALGAPPIRMTFLVRTRKEAAALSEQVRAACAAGPRCRPATIVLLLGMGCDWACLRSASAFKDRTRSMSSCVRGSRSPCSNCAATSLRAARCDAASRMRMRDTARMRPVRSRPVQDALNNSAREGMQVRPRKCRSVMELGECRPAESLARACHVGVQKKAPRGASASLAVDQREIGSQGTTRSPVSS